MTRKSRILLIVGVLSTFIVVIAAVYAWLVGQASSSPMDSVCWDAFTFSNSTVDQANSPYADVLYLHDIATLPTGEAWVVGSTLHQQPDFAQDTMQYSEQVTVMQFEPKAHAWEAVPVPQINGMDSNLTSLVAISQNDVWAVGSYGRYQPAAPSIFYMGGFNRINDDDGGIWDAHTLAMHWNGNKWSIVHSPDFGSDKNSLSSVFASSATDVWAIGGIQEQPLFLHWDGLTWSIKPAPSYGNIRTILGANALAPNDVWAAAETINNDGSLDRLGRPTMLHWDGSNWSEVTNISTNQFSASSGASVVNLVSGAEIRGSNDAWAVGTSWGADKADTLIWHWNGASWNLIPAPSGGRTPSGRPEPKFKSANIKDVSAENQDNVWAVGAWGNSTFTLPSDYNDQNYYEPFALHWDGTSWKVAMDALPALYASGGSGRLNQVATATGQVWLLGVYTAKNSYGPISFHRSQSNCQGP